MPDQIIIVDGIENTYFLNEWENDKNEWIKGENE